MAILSLRRYMAGIIESANWVKYIVTLDSINSRRAEKAIGSSAGGINHISRSGALDFRLIVIC